MKLLGLNHLDIVVDDLKKSIEFYRKFGLSIEGTVDNGKTVFLFNEDKENPVRVELHEKKPGQVTGIDHIAFTVEGPSISLLMGERLVLNCMQRMSAIATKTNTYLKILQGTNCTKDILRPQSSLSIFTPKLSSYIRRYLFCKTK